jgi:adenylate cyclase
MADTPANHKLTAILSADVVGYSRLMGDDEQATLATLTEYRTLMRGQIESRRRRVVGSPGDALLAEFPSAVQAVEAGIAIHIKVSKQVSKGTLPFNEKALRVAPPLFFAFCFLLFLFH